MLRRAHPLLWVLVFAWLLGLLLPTAAHQQQVLQILPDTTDDVLSAPEYTDTHSDAVHAFHGHHGKPPAPPPPTSNSTAWMVLSLLATVNLKRASIRAVGVALVAAAVWILAPALMWMLRALRPSGAARPRQAPSLSAGAGAVRSDAADGSFNFRGMASKK